MPPQYVRLVLRPRSITNQYELTPHRSLTEPFLCMTSRAQWNPLCNYRLDLLVAKEIKQRAQILAKPRGFPSLQILYAVGDNAPSTGRKVRAERVPRRSKYAAKAVAQTTCQLPLLQKRCEAINDDPA